MYVMDIEGIDIFAPSENDDICAPDEDIELR